MWYVTFNPNCNIFCLLERVQIPEDENFLDLFVCNIHSTDNICVNLSGEEYSVSILLNLLTGMEVGSMFPEGVKVIFDAQVVHV